MSSAVIITQGIRSKLPNLLYHVAFSVEGDEGVHIQEGECKVVVGEGQI